MPQTLEVEAVSRNRTGLMMGICGSKPFTWSVWIADVVDDIEGNRYHYVVNGQSGPVDLVVALTDEGKIVRTDPAAGDDLLATLPRC